MATTKEINAIKADTIPEAQHAHIEVIISDPQRGGYELRRSVQIPLDLYKKREWITPDQWRAGDRLFKDYRYAGIYCPRGMELQEITSRGSLHGDGVKQQEARERVREAFKAVHGRIGQLMVLNVCCYGQALKGVVFDHYNNSNQKMARFCEALDDLVKFYDSQ
jgi:hypothetical protein